MDFELALMKYQITKILNIFITSVKLVLICPKCSQIFLGFGGIFLSKTDVHQTVNTIRQLQNVLVNNLRKEMLAKEIIYKQGQIQILRQVQFYPVINPLCLFELKQWPVTNVDHSQ